MKINIDATRMPILSRSIGKTSQVEIEEGTLNNLIRYILNKIPLDTGNSLIDKSGQLDTMIQITINDEGIIPINMISHRTLKNGDTVRFILLLSGG